ncbi:MAG: T9SS type A sorting domain-containing protein [Saprospiraceae bacterium]|nr:T9SS type A sorting domain-containing protein [Saprospiraceae bacterium]
MMKKIYYSLLAFLVCMNIAEAQQRYVDQVFSNVTVDTTVIYGANATILTYSIPQIGQAVLQPLVMDIYRPTGDTETSRPVALFFHSGDFLPFPQNGGTNGTRRDSVCVEICTRLAKMGYVAASVDYRLGWNPIASTQDERVFTLINAAYRGVQDARTAIRYFKKTAAEAGNPWGIDPTKIVLWGQGTGGYITLNTATLNSYNEVLLPKFTATVGGNPVPMVLESVNGDIYGTSVGVVPAVFIPPFVPGDTLSYPNHTGYDSNFQLSVNMGGALGDETWMDNDGQPPIISYHVPTDPYAPYECAVLTVPIPPNPLPVVNVCGSKKVQELQDDLGINTPWKLNWNNYSSLGAASNNGGTRLEALYPFPRTSPTASAPWDFWSPTNVNAGSSTEPLDPVAAKMVIDTIMDFYKYRACITLDLGCNLGAVSIKEFSNEEVGLKVSPVPAMSEVTFSTDSKVIKHIFVYDLMGKLVKAHSEVNSNVFRMQRNALPKGMYLAQIIFEDGVTSKKIMFE